MGKRKIITTFDWKTQIRARVKGKSLLFLLCSFFSNELMLPHHELALPWFFVGVPPPPWIELQPNVPLAQFMPQAIHERTAFYSCNREVAIHCVIVRTNAIWAKPKSIYKQKRENKTVYPKSSIFFCWFNEIAAKPRWNLRTAQMKSKVKTLDEIKSVGLQPREAGFHRESDFIHRRWISPVEDGFDCVLSLTENTHTGLRC